MQSRRINCMGKIITIIFSTLILFLKAPEVRADGVIISILPRTRTYAANLPIRLKKHFVSIKVLNNICEVSVDEVFHNPHKITLEGEYIFPLPPGVFPSKFVLEVNGKKLEGEVLERERARRLYESIVRRMVDPALLEYYQNNLFRAKVFPIRARSDVKVKIKYEYQLPRKGEFYEIFYPMKIERIATNLIEELAINFRIESEKPVREVFSPTHKIEVIRHGNVVTGGYEGSRVRPNSDFRLYFSVSQEEISLSALTYRKNGEDGFFILTINAPVNVKSQKVLPKDIVFCLDISGSMSGEKIRQAKEGLKFFVEHLNPEDRFDIITFASDVQSFKGKLVKATPDNIKAAVRFINKLEAAGGTNINKALKWALSLLRGKRSSYVMFLTDGRPTVGATDPDEIIRTLKNDITGKKVFVFGVGYDVNTYLLDKLATISKGWTEYVEPGENLEIAISSAYSKIKNPVLTDLQVKFRGGDVYKYYPQEFGDLYAGQDVLIAGRYRKSGKVKVIVSGSRGNKKISVSKSFNFPSENVELDFIPLIWAKRYIGYLLSEVRLHGENKELVDEIISVSKKYGIVTPYTSYLITAEEVSSAPLALEEKDFRMRTGATGFKVAREVGRLKMIRQVSEPQPLKSIKRVGERVFYLQGEYYVDQNYREGMKTKDVKFGSEKYFELLRKYPEYAKYFSIAKKVIVVIDGVAYRIVE